MRINYSQWWDDMVAIMRDGLGVGLAATQLGVLRRVLVFQSGSDGEPSAIVNPEFEWRSDEIVLAEEGCLSLPGLYGKVRRARKIKVQAYDLGGNPIEVEADDLLGRAIQHESDHLDGKLFIDYLGPIARTTSGAKVKEIEAGYRKAQAEGIFPDDDEIRRQLDEVARAAASA